VNSEKLKKYLPFVFLLLFTVFHCLLPADAFGLSAKKTVLQNGLVVVHSEEHSLPILMLTLLVKAGPLNEPREKAGLANLTAELLTEGTKHRKSTEISEEIEFIGASLDISTSSDYIAISLSILKKDIEKGFDLFSDVLLNPVFPQQEIDRKKVLLKGSLKRNEEDPSFVAERAFRKEVFGDHPYGRLVEGSNETIDTIKREDIVKFFSDYFLPNNSILSVVGDLTQEELNVLVKRYLEGWVKADLPPTTSKIFMEKKSKKVIKVDKDLTQANIILGHLGICRDDPDYYAVSVMNYILGGGGFSSRLMQSIRDEMGLAYDVNSSFSMNKEKGIFQIEVQTKNESAGLVISEILKQMEKIRKETVSDEELSDAKSYLTGSFTRMLDTNRKIANFLALVEFYSLGLDYIGRYPGYINSVTKEDIRRVAKEYLHLDNCMLVIVADLKKTGLEIPPKE
jgi:zinc protease